MKEIRVLLQHKDGRCELLTRDEYCAKPMKSLQGSLARLVEVSVRGPAKSRKNP